MGNIDRQGVPIFEDLHTNRTFKLHSAFGIAKSKIVFSEVRRNVISGMKLRFNENLLLRKGGMITLKNQRSAELFGVTEKDEDDDEDQKNYEELDKQMLEEIRRSRTNS